ncbi:MAG: NADH-quinone oxidoreductase subunit J [Betaproteobacteria bacterium]|nr:NADH-quinone oxidoreductase subunit J [Betaproteobacteria bacterium]NBT75488.1 NADH-quinone oxidoreductase subunit J [Betaproteobacteria bacterium]NBY13498.1 NADH-quinone oxidoreductase subunit J [Betaproteobacteria bacterium]NCA15794.1 NADH-quinone oxidoreductase subunit J [Betaproteobacteria bacterium]NDF04754.1 NADH-quinone oxidoreductase subunit J [Betaproteobacteria bacterium]
MDYTTAFFFAFSAVLLFAAARVISSRNPVHSALFLVLTFFSAASLWLLLRAEFLAITLVLVYVGAVMVLFLFVVMMIDFDLERLRQGFWSNLKVALPVGVLILFEMGAIVLRSFQVAPAPAANNTLSNTQVLGMVLYTQYVYPFLLAAVILLVAMVAAIALTLRHRKDSRHQNVGEQVRVRARDRLRMVSFKKGDRA